MYKNNLNIYFVLNELVATLIQSSKSFNWDEPERALH